MDYRLRFSNTRTKEHFTIHKINRLSNGKIYDLHFLVSELNESTNKLDQQLVGIKIHIGTTWEVDSLKNIIEIYFRATRCDEEIQMAQNDIQ